MATIGSERIVVVIERGKNVAAATTFTGTVKTVAKTSGVTGAVLNAGIETLYSAGEVMRGKKGMMDAAGDIAYAGAKGGASAYAGGVAGTIAAGATSAAIAATGIGASLAAGSVTAAAVALAPAVAGLGVACAAGSFVSDLIDDIFS